MSLYGDYFYILNEYLTARLAIAKGTTMGVQLPGPMSSEAEQGFNPMGDMGGSYPAGQSYQSTQMDGDTSAEPYITDPTMAGMAHPDVIPVGNQFGSQGGNGSDDGSVSSNAGFHIITSFNQIYPGYTGTTSLGSEGEQNTDRTD
jgi:hypothetical protein